MAWRHGRSLLQTAPDRILKAFALVSCRCLSAPSVCSSERIHKSFQESVVPDFSAKRKVVLTHQIVHSTLLNCHSDLVALSFFLWCAKQPNYFHDTVAVDHMVSVVSRLTGRFESVRGLLGELRCVGCVIRAQTFLLLLRIYWRGGMYSFVFEAYEQMVCYGFTPNTFARNVIMDVLFKTGRADIALRVLKETKAPNFLTFNIALCNLSKLYDLVCIRDVIRFMMIMRYHPNAGAFELVLNCLCKMGRMQEAYQVLGLIFTVGIPMSVRIWSIIVDGFCRLRRLGDASYIMEKMVESGYSPNIVTYTTLVKGYMDSQLVSDAFGVLNIMDIRGHVPDLILGNVLIDSFSKIGKYDDAIGVFVGLVKQNIVPDSYTFSSLLSTISLSKRFFLLPELVHLIFVEVDLVLCNSLISCFCKAGFHSFAVELYAIMLDRGFTPDKYSFVGLLSGLCGSRRIDIAVNVYHGILLNYTCLDAHIHTVIIDGLIKAGKFHSAIKVFRRAALQKYSLDVVSYTVAIRGLLRGGRNIEAFNLYNQMKEVGVPPNAHTCNILLSSFCRERDFQMVKQMLEEMIDLGAELSCNNLFRLSNILSKTHHCHLLFGLLVEMKDLGLIPPSVTCGLSFDRPTKDVNVVHEHYILVRSCLEHGVVIDSDGSEDFPNVAASVG